MMTMRNHNKLKQEILNIANVHATWTKKTELHT